MAGKFLSVEEAARRLGVSVEEINRLVDRKELFPMRDGATIKFKADDIERFAADLGVGSTDDEDDLTLDLSLKKSGLEGVLPDSGLSGGKLVVDDGGDEESIFASQEGSAVSPTGSLTVVRGGAPKPTSGVFETDDLALESIVSASSPSLAVGEGLQSGTDGSGTIAIDLGDLGAGSLAGSLAGALDSGLSLEETLDISGVDLDKSGVAGSVAGSGVGDSLAGSLAGDAFDLGAGLVEEESASVVIPTEESGDSSFFPDAMDDSASVSFDGSGISSGVSMTDLSGIDLVPAASAFTVWQVVGLICCTVLMFVGGLVVFDVLTTLWSPQSSPVSSPLLNGLAKTFGWR
ncbi:MAG: helix-turn-helix domain-containing protein [Planctomycetes bacterium]|nr:helix-turn-helix domain-containing protein [Planctomycetota bacterium]